MSTDDKDLATVWHTELEEVKEIEVKPTDLKEEAFNFIKCLKYFKQSIFSFKPNEVLLICLTEIDIHHS